jgi:uncharacterized protein
MNLRMISLLLPALLFSAVLAAPLVLPRNDARRIEVLFFGAPIENSPAHNPITRYRVLKKALGLSGINLTYSENPAVVWNPETLARFDAVLMYGNWEQHGTMPPDQLKALLDFVEGGGGFLPIHCASACYGASPGFVRLVGARFQSHGDGEFQVRTVNPQHPVLSNIDGFRAWDETYVHDSHADDRDILQMRDKEPWTWTRTQGQGRVFYTAAGHDHRVWDLPAFHHLLRNAIYWAVGPETYQLMRALDPPQPEQEAASLPGYRERREITEAQKPLDPAASMKLAQVPPGFELALFACEPDIVNPIHIAWDHLGRAFVIETIDYPNNLQAGNLGNDRITICEDTNGDGRADKFTRFAENLSIPTSMVFARGGVICTNGTEMIFLKDTTGDGRADQREVLFSGFKMHDTHAGVSNLRPGLDGWIYATIGYSGFDGEVGGKHHTFGQGVFRFLPDGSALEFLQGTTNNTWGLGFTEEFDVLGSTANANPSFFMTFPAAAYQAAGLKAPRTPRADDNPFFNPMSMDIRQVDAFDRYTSAAGHALYTARRFPAEFWNRAAFVTDPTGKLVGHFDMRREGAGWKAVHSANNLYASADAWSAPVFAEVGPDGAVWIGDWYNLIIQHNPTPSVASAGVDAKTGIGNAYVTPLRDKQHGRIYRIYPKDSANDPSPQLDPAQPASWVAGLSHPNQLWRLHAQRLLVESDDTSQAAALAALVTGDDPLAAAHALHALAGLDTLDRALVERALASPQASLRRASLHLAWPDEVKRAYLRDGGITTTGRELAEVMIALGGGAADPEIGSALWRIATETPALFDDAVLADAWRIAARRQATTVRAAAGDINTGGHPQHLLNELTLLAGHAAGTGDAGAGDIVRKFPPDAAVHARGKEVYALTCIACHGVDGKGVPEAFPPLDGTPRVTGNPEKLIQVVLHGMIGPLEVNGVKYNGAMPPLGPSLNDPQVADVLTYVRQIWSNDAAAVTPEQVAKVRAAHPDRLAMWTAQELDAPQAGP